MASVGSLLRFSSLALLSAFAGCSNPQSSEVKTLDAFSSNLTSSGLRCSAEGVTFANVERHSFWRFKDKILPAVSLSEAQKVFLVKQTVVALTAVPESLLELFFASGDLRITPEASTICASHTAKDESKGYAGCVIALTDEGKLSHSIIADASDYGVSGTVVRSFGYWVSQNLSGLYAAAGKTYKLSSKNTEFLENQRKITDLYFRDVIKGNKFDISHFDSFFGEHGTEKIRENVLENKNEALASVTFNTKNKEQRAKNRRQFESFVFAESFDSFHCNSFASEGLNTNKTFLDLFPRTHAKFASVILRVNAEVQVYLETKAPKKISSFSLLSDSTSSGITADSPAVIAPQSTSETVVAEPIVTGNSQPEAVTIIIDAQGKIIDQSQIQVIQPEKGLDQDLNIEIINQGIPESGVQIGGLQPVVPLDANIVSPLAPVTPTETLEPEEQKDTEQNPPQEPIQNPGQHPQPGFSEDMGKESDFFYPDFNGWPGHGGFHSCGG